MSDATPPGAGSPEPDTCPLCGGRWIDGRMAMPLVGSLRFVYRLGTNDVAAEVRAQMCTGCGHVRLRARDPEPIRRAEYAATHSRSVNRWDMTAQRVAGAYRSRHGTGPER
jgi:hypothetical protein